MQVELRILGPLEVGLAQGRTAAVPRGRVRALLAVLAVHHGRVVALDRILDELWGAAWPEREHDAVYVVASRLRSAVGPGLVSSRGGGYALDLPPEAIDAVRFEGLLARGRAELARREPAEAAATLRHALGLWRGPALSDVGDAPLAREEAARLEALRLGAVRERLQADLACGRHAEVLDELEALVAARPLDEALRGALMLALYRSGRQAEALAAYRQGAEALRDDLGLEPSAGLRALELAILRQEVPGVEQETATAAPQDDRRRVTCLYAQLAADRPSAEEHDAAADPEAILAALDRVHDAMASACTAHGGTVVDLRNDGLLAVFGHPLAHEDDALRAVRGAVDVRDRVASLRAGALARVGVATGDVVLHARRGGPAPVGEPVMLAEALARDAAVDEIRLAAGTWALVRHAATGSSLPGDAVALGRVDAHAPPIDRRLDAPLVGRRAEVEHLEAALARVATSRRAELVAVLGEAGIGKTRLVAELGRRGEPRARVLCGRCPSYGEGMTFWPLRQVVAQAANGRSSDGLAADLRVDPVIVQRLASAVGLEAGDAGDEIADAAAALLAALARERPLAVVVDDAHWAEPALLELLLELRERLRDAPVLLVCVARADVLDERPGWPGGVADAGSLRLGPLSAADSEELLQGLPGGAPSPDEGRRLARAAGGNPLFLEQLAAFVQEHAASGSLPPALQPLLAARLDRLDATERLVLACGAVEGETFGLGAVHALAGGTTRADLEDTSARLIRRDLLAPADAGRLRFRHALIRDAAYATLTKARRAELHELLAAELAAHPEGLAEPDAAVGLHLERAARAGQEIGRPRADLERRAGARLAAAADVAGARGDVPRVIGLLRRAVALLGPETPAAAALLPDLASALHEAGAYDEAEVCAEQALERATRLGLAHSRARAAIEQARMRLCRHPSEFDPDWAEDVVAEAAHALAAADDHVGLARAEYLRQDLAWLRGDLTDCDHHLNRMREHAARGGNTLEMAIAFAYSGWNLVEGPLPLADALTRCGELEGEAAGLAGAEAALAGARAALTALGGRFAEAVGPTADARARLVRLGLRELTAYLAVLDAQCMRVAGHHEAAEAALRSAGGVWSTTGDCWMEAIVRVNIAGAVVAQGRLGDAAAATAHVDDLPSPVDRVWVAKRHIARAGVASAAGSHGEAAAEARAAVAATTGTGLLLYAAEAGHALAAVLDAAGAADESAAARARALALDAEKGVVRAG